MSSRVEFSQVKSRQSGFVELCPVALRQVLFGHVRFWQSRLVVSRQVPLSQVKSSFGSQVELSFVLSS